MGKWEITMNPVQEWGEEFEDGAVYGVTLRREPVPSSADSDEVQPCSAYVQYRTCKVRRLKAATLDILVGELLDPCCQDPDYASIFLSTYRTFTSPLELIKLLFKKDKAASDLDNSECQTSGPLSVLIQSWLEEYSEDLRDPPYHSSLRHLVEHLRSRAKFCSLAQCAETLLHRFQAEETKVDGPSAWVDVEQEQEEEEESSVEETAEWERPREQGDIMDFSVTSIAEQLTRLDSSLFVKVVPYQCLGCVWSQRDKKENMSPTIRATVTQFNAVTNRVITSLLCWPSVSSSSSPTQSRRPTSTPAQRARVIEKWIRVAQECRQLKNFSSLRAILSALQSNAVYRLRRTWAAVSRESMAAFDNLWETFPDENCVLTSREILLEDGGQPAMDNSSPGPSKRCPVARQLSVSCVVVPYLGTYLTVLTMLDTALPDIVDNLINFEKRRREFDILSQIRLLQLSCSQYNLPHHPRIGAWLQEHTLLTDQESYELSRGLEPPVDVCSPAAWNHRTISKKLSFLLTGDGSKKASGDQMSVCSSGSSGSEMEDLSSSTSACSIRLQTLSTSCQNVAEASSSSSSSSSLECPTTSGTSSSSQPDLSNPTPVPDADPGPKPASAPYHKRSISMTSLPVYNRQVADSCIVRVSIDLGTDNGNMYKSILLTSQDKTAQVIQRALEKHHLEERDHQDFTLAQVISQERELIIPDKSNVFYAMSTSANYDFILRQIPKGQRRPLAATCSLGRYSR